MEITYKKLNNSELFKSFEDKNLLNTEKNQNFIPLYTKFFALNGNNYNSICLNNQNALISIHEKKTENIFLGNIKNENGEILPKQIFFKLSPLLDPFKYLAGKYDTSKENLFNLPKFMTDNCHYKIADSNNSAYVDSFFTYLTSQLLNRIDFLHGLDFYGSYLGCKKNYHVDIGEDIEMLSNNDFFYENTNKLYKFLNSDHENLFNEDSRKNKKRLEISNIDSDYILNLEDINSLDLYNKSDDMSLNSINDTSNSELIFEDNLSNKQSSKSSEISSRSSNTEDSCSSNSGSSENSENSEYTDTETSSDIESIMVSIEKFPIQIIALENCSNTLDQLFVHDNLSQDELSCIVIQILMTLITYQKLFSLTHNDLHTNNIMYIKTDKKYLYYKLNGRHYKIKTYGKIFKIIDFGRAIYKYRNQLICSDSFHKEGDAATQYNFEPYYNSNKSIVEPNYSFDLCRLGCSIYDFITEKFDHWKDVKWPIHKIIMKWCDDDDGRNILYKNTDEERYPDFKLYKMIARKVHNHIPSEEIKHKYFDNYIVSKKEIKKGSKIMNIDMLDTDILNNKNT